MSVSVEASPPHPAIESEKTVAANTLHNEPLPFVTILISQYVILMSSKRATVCWYNAQKKGYQRIDMGVYVT